MSATFIVGDTREVLASLPAGSADLILSSPPFLALRSYLPADDPLKELEIGSEATPGEFIDTLLDVTEACARVLAPHGSLCFELGDTFSGSGGGGGDYLPGGLREDQPGFGGSAERQREGNAAHWRLKNAQRDAWPLDKSLALIPETYRFALVYGFNPHTGRQTPRWRARNVVTWCRPNPPVGALGDKFRPGTSDLVVACKAKDRYFDLDSVRTEHKSDPENYTGNGYTKGKPQGDGDPVMKGNPAGAPPLDWWKIPASLDHLPRDPDFLLRVIAELLTGGDGPFDWWSISPAGFAGAHYATWPPELCIRPMEAMCPRRVCIACGKPSRREVDIQRAGVADDRQRRVKAAAYRLNAHDQPPELGWEMNHTTTGWSSCGCPGTDGIRLDGFHSGPGWRPGVVLDPFCGTFTTGVVAHGHGRDSIGIDLDARNADLARERLGMFLDVEMMPRERPIIDHHLPENDVA